MVCLIFHTAIIINRKNWRLTIKFHLENLSIFFEKSERENMLEPPLPVRFCSPGAGKSDIMDFFY